MAIIPVPSRRASDVLLRERLLNQLQNDQLSMLRIQDQVSTGRRFNAPSEDAPAAIRALSLQSLLEQKTQVRTNLQATASFLSASESTISNASQLATDIRGLALTTTNSTMSKSEREAAVSEITRAITQFQTMANRQYRDRYLFAGSNTQRPPYEAQGDFVIYRGNERTLRSFADIGMLTNSSFPGQEIFGGLSSNVAGSADLTPVLSDSTRLSDLREGRGIRDGSIKISDGTNSSTIDISTADTVGDLVRIIEANPPLGRVLTVRLQGESLVLDLDDAGGGNLTVEEVGGGTTAAELGILNPLGSGTSPFTGESLEPRLRLTTPLNDLLGTRAYAIIDSNDPDSDLRIEANESGDALNGVRFQFVDDSLLQAAAGLTAGNETARYETSATPARAALTLSGANNNLVLTAATAGVEFNDVDIQLVNGGLLGNAATATYDPGMKRLTLGVDQTGATQVQTLIDAINAEGTFTAAYDASDAADGGFVPTAGVNAADIGAVRGDTGNSGGEAGTIFAHIEPGKSTAAQVLAALEAAPDVAASFTATLDGKDRDQNGLTGDGTVALEAAGILDQGSGEALDKDAGLHITNGGSTYTIDFSEAESVEDLLNAINGSPAQMLAEINARGDGINLRSRLSGGDFRIGENGGRTAEQLGVLSFGSSTSLEELNYGRGVETLPGTDFTVRRNDGVELEINLSSAGTIQDVLDAINGHPDNQDAGAVEARLLTTGTGIELVDDNPVGTGSLTILKGASAAAWDLNLIPRGSSEFSANANNNPQAASATATFPEPLDVKNRFEVTANQVGADYNNIAITLVDSGAVSGNNATVSFDPAAGRLTIDIDQSATDAATIVAAITAEGTFSANLDLQADPDNDGSGLVSLGTAAVTTGGVDHASATPAVATAQFAAPNDANSALRFEAVQPGTDLNGVVIEIRDTLAAGNPPAVTFDSGANRLFIDIHQASTTADDVISAVIQEGTFRAERDLEADPTHDGSGTVGLGEVAVTAGGTAEVLTVADSNPQETQSLFNTLIRLKDAVQAFDVREIERAVEMLDADFERINFGRAELGAQQRTLDALHNRLEDEDVELRAQLSIEIDVDLTEAISNLTARQASMEASLRLIGRSLQLTLLDFL